mmetsp:Transcript_92115/g.246237  ORF Transcript_92115/g.246237 Transcript_92115/m.246237 type:complete len:221 (-) Transcript_92115:101-763(-)
MSHAWAASKCNSTLSTCDGDFMDEENASEPSSEESMPPLPASAARCGSTKRAAVKKRGAFRVQRSQTAVLEARESGIHSHHSALGTWVNTPMGTGFVSEISMRQGKEFSEVTLVGHGSVQVCSDEIDGKELLPSKCTYVGQLAAYMCAPAMLCHGHQIKHTENVATREACPREEEAKMRRRRLSKEFQRSGSNVIGAGVGSAVPGKGPAEGKLRRCRTAL